MSHFPQRSFWTLPITGKSLSEEFFGRVYRYPNTMIIKLSAFGLFTTLASISGISVAAAKCEYLPTADAPPIELALPIGTLSHSVDELKLEFRGLTPIVTRQTIGYGETPKVVVKRYSTEPSIYYDDTEGKVVVAGPSCGQDEPKSGAATSCANWLPMAGASLMAGLLGGPAAAASVAAAGFVPLARAHEESCEPVVQIMVQAPSSYMGVRETCLKEINDDEICPEPFPTYPVCDDPAPTCGVVVVGAGAGGLYTALR